MCHGVPAVDLAQPGAYGVFLNLDFADPSGDGRRIRAGLQQRAVLTQFALSRRQIAATGFGHERVVVVS